MIIKLLGENNINNDDYVCLQEINKLTTNKEFKTILFKAMKFFHEYKSSKLYTLNVPINSKTNELTSRNHEPISETSFYNLLAFNKWPKIFFET